MVDELNPEMTRPTSSLYTILVGVRYIQRYLCQVMSFVPLSMRVMIVGVLEVFFNCLYHLLIHSKKEDHEYLDMLVEAYSLGSTAKRVVVITGCTDGIGREIALNLAKSNLYVIMACRSEEKTLKTIKEFQTVTTNKDIYFIKCDLSSQKSIKEFAEEFLLRGIRIDVLINNAGIYSQDLAYTTDGVESQFGVNFLGHFLLFRLLEHTFSDGSMVINVGSIVHYAVHGFKHDYSRDWGRYHSSGLYALSKYSVSLFTMGLNLYMKDKGIKAITVHPGYISTKLFRDCDMLSTLTGVARYLVPWSTLDAKQGALSILCLVLDGNALKNKHIDCMFSDTHWYGVNVCMTESQAVNMWSYGNRICRLC